MPIEAEYSMNKDGEPQCKKHKKANCGSCFTFKKQILKLTKARSAPRRTRGTTPSQTCSSENSQLQLVAGGREGRRGPSQPSAFRHPALLLLSPFHSVAFSLPSSVPYLPSCVSSL
ncbi:hypothetical protein BJY59DRAFT_572115 [Rhodotorula toruloides]